MKNLYKASLLACVSAIAFNATHVTTCSAMKKKYSIHKTVGGNNDNDFDLICSHAKKGDVEKLEKINRYIKCWNTFYQQNPAKDGVCTFGFTFYAESYGFEFLSQETLWETLKIISEKGNIKTMEVFFLIVEKIFTQASPDCDPKKVTNYYQKLKKCFEIAKNNNQTDIAKFLSKKLK